MKAIREIIEEISTFLRKLPFKLLMLVFPPALLFYKKDGRANIFIRTTAMLLTITAYVVLIILFARPTDVISILRAIGIGIGLSALTSVMSGLLSGWLDMKAIAKGLPKPSSWKKLALTVGLLLLGLLPTLEIFGALTYSASPAALQVLATNILSLSPATVIAIPLTIITVGAFLAFTIKRCMSLKQLGITQGQGLLNVLSRLIFGTDPSSNTKTEYDLTENKYSSHASVASALREHTADSEGEDEYAGPGSSSDGTPLQESPVPPQSSPESPGLKELTPSMVGAASIPPPTPRGSWTNARARSLISGNPPSRGSTPFSVSRQLPTPMSPRPTWNEGPYDTSSDLMQPW